MKNSKAEAISSEVITKICGKLTKGEAVNEILPKNGILHIDKYLPFICVYRFTEPDLYFSRVIKTQASYIIIDSTVNIIHLLEAVQVIMSNKFDTFLILECWPVIHHHEPELQIFCPKNKAVGTIKALKEGFSKMDQFYPNLSISAYDSEDRHPKDLAPLFNNEKSKKAGILILGLAIPSLYKNNNTQELYALFFRKFYTTFSQTIMHAVYEFIRLQTSGDFENYLTLGKTNIDAITLKADTELADISSGMSFLLRVTPVNSNEEWVAFENSNFKKIPDFKYRLITIDPELEKRKLYNIQIDEVDDPTIADILRGKRLEIEKQLIMLEERGTDNFRLLGQSLYGVVEKHVLEVAEHILNVFPCDENREIQKRMNCHKFAEHAQEEINYYQSKFPNIDLQLEIRNDVAGIMVSESTLLINNEINLDVQRCDALIQHEVATHILTYCNGKRQPLKQMFEGFERYDQLQEGLAVMAEYLVGGLTINRLRLLAGRVIAVESMVNKASFIETFNLLTTTYHFSKRTSYYIAMRVYRGGGLTKDAVYLAGIIDVMHYLKNGGKLDNLYTGKFNTSHIALIDELVFRNVLKPPVLPRFLERESVKRRLEKLNKGIDITELTN